MVFVDEPPLVAKCVVLLVLLCFLCYVHGFLMVLAGRPPSAAIRVFFINVF